MKPICPSCNEEMSAKYFIGYYERFSFWQCGCKIIPNSTIVAGSFSHAEDGELTEEYFAGSGDQSD